MKSYNIFDIVCAMSFNEEKTQLKQINLLCSLMKVLCFIILANINFDSLKPMILMSMINHVLEHRENWRPMICKDY